MFFSEHDTNPDKPKYRPPFLDHFDRKKAENLNNLTTQTVDQMAAAASAALAGTPLTPTAPPLPSIEISPLQPNTPAMATQQNVQTNDERQRYQSHLQLQLNQISVANQIGVQQLMHQGGMGGGGGAIISGADNAAIIPQRPSDANKYQRNFVDGEFEFVSV